MPPPLLCVAWLMVWWFFFRCVFPSLVLVRWPKLFICLWAFSQILHNLMTISIVWPVLLCHNPLLPYLMLSYLIILLWIGKQNSFSERIHFFHISSFCVVSLRNFMIHRFAVVLRRCLWSIRVYILVIAPDLPFFFSSIWFCFTTYTLVYVFVFSYLDVGFESFYWSMAFIQCQ